MVKTTDDDDTLERKPRFDDLCLDLNDIAERWVMIQGEARYVLSLAGVRPDKEGEYGEDLWHIEDIEELEHSGATPEIKKVFARRPRTKRGELIQGMHKTIKPKRGLDNLILAMYADRILPGSIAVRLSIPMETVNKALRANGYDPSGWAEYGPNEMVSIPSAILKQISGVSLALAMEGTKFR